MDNQGNETKLAEFSFCVFCGTKCLAGSLYCGKCGQPISNPIPISDEERNERRYQQALLLLASNRYDDASKMFSALGDYKDSKEKVNECATAKENEGKERLYQGAIALLNAPNVTDVALKSVIGALEEIADYKDTKDQIARLEQRLEKWYEDKAIAEENARKEQYEKALEHLEAERFDEASAIFVALGDYSDSKEMVEKTAQAKEEARKLNLYNLAVNVLDLDKPTIEALNGAKADLESLGDYKDSEQKIEQIQKRIEERTEEIALEKKQKKKKAIIIGSISLAIAIIIGIIIFLVAPRDIEYDLGGGVVSEENKTTYNVLTKEITLNNPTRYGYTFIGWTGEGIDEPTLNVTIKGGTKKLSYTANWKANDYTLTFDPAGGTQTYITMGVAYGTYVELPIPVKEGYTFLGWFADDIEYDSTVWYTTKDLELEAKWIANTYDVTLDNTLEEQYSVKVTFDYCDGTRKPLVQKLFNGETLEIPNIPTVSGYVFSGWYTDSKYTTLYDFTGTITEDITLYAGWKQITLVNSYAERQIDPSQYTSSYSYSCYSISTQYTSSSSKQHIVFSIPKDGNYTINYCNSSYSSYDKYYLEITNLSTGSTIKSNSTVSSTYYDDVSFSASCGDVIVMAIYKYSSSSYDYANARFYFEGFDVESTATASCSTDIVYQYYDESICEKKYQFDTEITLPVPTRRGYTFLGWYNGEQKVESGIWKIASNVTLTPKWEANDNTINLSLNGGSASTTSLTVTYDEEFTLPTPTKAGHTFLGWFDSNDTQYTSGTWNGIEDITLTAKWSVNTYNVTFEDSKKKTATITFDGNYTGSTPTVITLNDGETLEYFSAPGRVGYAFAGWYTDSACTTKFNFTDEITDDMTLYANWIEAYTGSYSTLEIDPTTYNSSNAGKISTANTSSSARIYMYFTAHETGEHKIYYKNSSSSYSYAYYLFISNLTTGETIKSNSTVSSTSYSYVSFDASAGDIIAISVYKYSSSSYSYSDAYFYFEGFGKYESNSVASVKGFEFDDASSITSEITYGSTLALPEITKTGYEFLGWYNGDNRVYSGVWHYESDITLTPKWKAIESVITLDANNGTVSTNKVNATYDKEFTLPTPTKAGHTFLGWFDSNDTQYQSGTWDGLEDITLTAKWSVNTYNLTLNDVGYGDITITYDYNYSGSTPTTQNVANGATLSYPTNPTRSGYVFTGWYLDKACTQRYGFTATITKDITLYAGWISTASTGAYSTVEINPTSYNSSSYAYSTSTNHTTSSSTKNIYLVANESGAHAINYKNSNSSYSYYLYIYNVTTGKTISSYTYVSSTTYQTISFNCEAGDVIKLSLYRSSTSSSYYYSTAYLYFTGFTNATSTAKASSEKIECSEGTNITKEISYGSNVILPILEKEDYIFLGWYNGEQKVESGIWNYETDLELTQKWEKATLYSVTLENTKTTVTVTLDYNYTDAPANQTYEIKNGEILGISVPTRTGYAFDGWYTDSACTVALSDYTIKSDITLYAKWKLIKYSITNDTTNPWSISGGNFTSSNKGHSSSSALTITASKSITVSFSYNTSSEQGYDYLRIYKNGSSLYSTSGTGNLDKTVNLDLVAGDTLTFTYSKDSSSSSGNDCAYIKNFMVDGATTSNDIISSGETNDIILSCETNDYEYSESASDKVVIQVAHGYEYTLPELTKEGYTFDGWYNGTEKIPSTGIWTIEQDVTLTPKWN